MAIEEKTLFGLAASTVNVVDKIALTERQPARDAVDSIGNREIVTKENVALKRIIGVIVLVGGIAFTLYKMGSTGMILFWGACMIVPISISYHLFKRNVTLSSEKTFKRLWGSVFFSSPNIVDGKMEIRVRATNPANVVKQGILNAYPFPVTVDDDALNGFVEQMEDRIKSAFAASASDGDKGLYAAKLNSFVKRSKSDYEVDGKSICRVSGCVTILKYDEKASFTKECVDINIKTYFVGNGKYWLPVNPVPDFFS
jgi:hypothetical protein